MTSPSQTESDTHTNDVAAVDAAGADRGQASVPMLLAVCRAIDFVVAEGPCEEAGDDDGYCESCTYCDLARALDALPYDDVEKARGADATPPQADGKAVRHG